jgi:ferredoxin--NADP+ reductase
LKTVFVVGAGPAGMFAAQKIAQAGHEVIILNRDIKPGGLAEYGIYPLKDKMKFGLRKQFAKVLSLPNVHYLGHVKIGSEYDLTIEELRAMNPTAIVFSCGAQGYNQLGLPGENAKGVYSAKDFVYYYNQLPPYASQDYSTGKRIAIIGMGNVAVDIMRWLLQDSPIRQTEEVVVVARRGPYEAKFDEKEIEHVEMHLNREDFLRELERVKDRCAACNQDVSPEKVAEAAFPFLKKPDLKPVTPKLSFRFLTSPKEIVPGQDGRIQKLIVTENNLALKADGATAAKATDQTSVLDIDTMIFAIGDKHDPKVGLPMGRDGYATKPNPENPKEPVFEVFDPGTGTVMDGYYVVGWARRASDGLVGIARHDGEVGAGKVLDYLQAAPEKPGLTPEQVQARLEAKGIRVVTKCDLDLLGKVESREAQARGLGYFKYSDDESMLNAIVGEKAKGAACGAAAHD